VQFVLIHIEQESFFPFSEQGESLVGSTWHANPYRRHYSRAIHSRFYFLFFFSLFNSDGFFVFDVFAHVQDFVVHVLLPNQSLELLRLCLLIQLGHALIACSLSIHGAGSLDC
jgi:hypothetical protein